jgi:hypothetical protein
VTTPAGTLRVPRDEEAEAVCAAAVVANPVHARGLDDLGAADFYDPALGRIFRLRSRLAGFRWVGDREAMAANLASVPVATVRELVAGCPVMWGFEPWARRVRDAAARRRLMAGCRQAYTALGDGQPLVKAVDLVMAGID